jgi:hypothetical protein
MPEPTSSHGDLSELERQLAALSPIGRVDRDRLMFAAGRRVGQRRLRATQRWLAVTSAGFGAMLAFTMLNPLWSIDRGRDLAPVIAERPEPDAASPPDPRPAVASSDPNSNYRLLQQLAAGVAVEGRDEPETASTPAAFGVDSQRDDTRWLLNRYLEEARTRL